MRRRRVGQREVRQGHWEAHEKVLIKGFSEADAEWIQDEAMRMRGDDVSNAEMRVLAGTSRMATLLRGIVSWTLTDEQGRGMPWPPLFDGHGNMLTENAEMRKQMIGTLMPEDAEFLYTEIGKLNEPRSKEEQEAFLGGATNGFAEIGRMSLLASSNEQ